MIPVPLLAALLAGGGTPPEPVVLRVTPQVIEAGSWYDGATLKVEGMAAPGSNVIIIVTGSEHEEQFNRKRRFGPIWINSGRVRISGVPSLFLRFSSEPVATVLRTDEVACRRLDADSLASRIDPALRAGYLALKKGEGAYRFGNGGVALDGNGCFSLDLRWPKRAPPGDYDLRLFEVRGGAVVREASMRLAVTRTGFPAWMADLAEQRAPLYGAIAVLIGALAGFGIDFLTTCIFGGKRHVAH